ncbi:Stress response protein nst1, partial [Orchesella cincta]
MDSKRVTVNLGRDLVMRAGAGSAAATCIDLTRQDEEQDRPNQAQKRGQMQKEMAELELRALKLSKEIARADKEARQELQQVQDCLGRAERHMEDTVKRQSDADARAEEAERCETVARSQLGGLEKRCENTERLLKEAEKKRISAEAEANLAIEKKREAERLRTNDKGSKERLKTEEKRLLEVEKKKRKAAEELRKLKEKLEIAKELRKQETQKQKSEARKRTVKAGPKSKKVAAAKGK